MNTFYGNYVKNIQTLKCGACCGEITLKLPDYRYETHQPQITNHVHFYMTEKTAFNRPIYESEDGDLFLRPFNTFWVVTRTENDADFLFFIEDLEKCPHLVDQSGWEFLKDLRNFGDNRISVECRERKVSRIGSNIMSNNMSNQNNGACCKTLNLSVPKFHHDKTLVSLAGNYDQKMGSPDIYINSKGEVTKFLNI